MFEPVPTRYYRLPRQGGVNAVHREARRWLQGVDSGDEEKW
jgi:hypothetical protein